MDLLLESTLRGHGRDLRCHCWFVENDVKMHEWDIWDFYASYELGGSNWKFSAQLLGFGHHWAIIFDWCYHKQRHEYSRDCTTSTCVTLHSVQFEASLQNGGLWAWDTIFISKMHAWLKLVESYTNSRIKMIIYLLTSQ